MDEDRAAAASMLLTMLLQVFGAVVLGLSLVLFWQGTARELLDWVAGLRASPRELRTSTLLTGAVVLLLFGNSLSFALRAASELYFGWEAVSSRQGFWRFGLDAASFFILAMTAFAAAEHPPRVRVMIAGIGRWHMTLLAGRVLRGAEGQRGVRGTLANGGAAAVYVALAAGLSSLPHTDRNDWRVGLAVLFLALAVSLPALWRTLPRQRR
ncbi:MAG: hypothetical protein HYU88_12415 [Chloroflexi bacterium]|nr:hypothetical protein [Chloroflexota bacterium]